MSVLLTCRTYFVNALCRRRNRRTVLLSCLLIIVVIIGSSLTAWNEMTHDLPAPIDWEYEYEKARKESLKENMAFYVEGRNLLPVPPSWTAREKCPACFGTEMCDAVDRKELLVDIPPTLTPANRKGVYLGKWLDVPVAVKRLANWYPKEFELFDSFVCLNTTGQKECNVSTAIVSSSSYAQRQDTFDPTNLLHAWRISYEQTGPLALTYALCLTKDIVERFSGLYSSGGQLSPEERAKLFTSMVVQPESLMLKFLKDAQSDRLAPRVYGACGRLVIVEHGGRLLDTYINASFAERAELTLQLISLMKMLWHADQKWFALYNDVQYENIAVSHSGQVYLIDYEHLSIIQNIKPDVVKPGDDVQDPDDVDHDDGHQLDEPVQCNDDCFNRLFANLSNERLSTFDRQQQCKALHDVSEAFMYAALCRNILADSTPANSATDVDTGRPTRGLLHDVPNDEDVNDRRQKIQDALKECIHETKPGGRTDAVETISEILSVYTGLRLE